MLGTGLPDRHMNITPSLYRSIALSLFLSLSLLLFFSLSALSLSLSLSLFFSLAVYTPPASQEVAEDKKVHDDAVLLRGILPTETSYVGGQANDLKVSQGGRSGCQFHARINSDPKTSNLLHGDLYYRATMRERDWQHSLVVSQIHQRIFGTSHHSGNQNEWVDDMWDKQGRQSAQKYLQQVPADDGAGSFDVDVDGCLGSAKKTTS